MTAPTLSILVACLIPPRAPGGPPAGQTAWEQPLKDCEQARVSLDLAPPGRGRGAFRLVVETRCQEAHGRQTFAGTWRTDGKGAARFLVLSLAAETELEEISCLVAETGTPALECVLGEQSFRLVPGPKR